MCTAWRDVYLKQVLSIEIAERLDGADNLSGIMHLEVAANAAMFVVYPLLNLTYSHNQYNIDYDVIARTSGDLRPCYRPLLSQQVLTSN